MTQFLRVSGHDSLFRDVTSQAIINTNTEEYQNYMQQRQTTETRLALVEHQAEEINTIKGELSDIKQMLVMLLQDR